MVEDRLREGLNNMDDKVSVESININGNDYILLDVISADDDVYRFYYDAVGDGGLQIFREVDINGEVSYSSLDNESDYNYALMLFYQKYKK